MFTGIIESLGTVADAGREGTNIRFTIHSPLSVALKVDQSLSHNGVCLTVEEAGKTAYRVTAIEETLRKSNLGDLQKGDLVNLERSLTLQSRLDGHLVQGHVDATGECTEVRPQDGSRIFTFSYPETHKNLLVEKGSVTVNGVSLTAFNCLSNRFSVAVIPYTYNNTNFKTLEAGAVINLEFDIIGKYVSRFMADR